MRFLPLVFIVIGLAVGGLLGSRMLGPSEGKPAIAVPMVVKSTPTEPDVELTFQRLNYTTPVVATIVPPKRHLHKPSTVPAEAKVVSEPPPVTDDTQDTSDTSDTSGTSSTGNATAQNPPTVSTTGG